MIRSTIPLLVLTMILAACGPPIEPARRQTFEEKSEAEFDAWVVFDASGRNIDSSWRRIDSSRPPPDEESRLRRSAASLAPAPRQSVQPALRKTLARAKNDEILRVVLSVRTDLRLSALPRRDRRIKMSEADARSLIAERTRIQERDAAIRQAERAGVVAAIEQRGGEVVEQFRLGNAVVANLAADDLRALLAERNDIVAASLDNIEARVDAVADRSLQYMLRDHIDDGRLRQGSDRLVAAGYDGTGYRVGLVDTGVSAAHKVFMNPYKVRLRRDCAYSSKPDCTWSGDYRYTGEDTNPHGGQGTFMANIMVGNSALGDAYRGVAPGARVDSANVYLGSNHTVYSQSAVLRAMEMLGNQDDVIVIDALVDDRPGGTTSLAADDLYDQGVIVLSPVGNNVNFDTFAPANAHKVLGIGAYFVHDGSDFMPQSSKIWNADLRFKPDVTAPTHVNAAANTSASAVHGVSGTWPAAAFAGGAALLLRQFYDAHRWSPDAGAIYAALITFGDEASGDLDNRDGAGNLELGETSSAVWHTGVRYVPRGDTDHVIFFSRNNACDLRAGIWWAEDEISMHNTVTLKLYENNTLRASSEHLFSVFQKVAYPHRMEPGGYWRLILRAFSGNPKSYLLVHFLIHYRTNCW